jgi:hypothetical protein
MPDDEGDGAIRVRAGMFQPIISLGNILTFVGIVGSCGVALIIVGEQVQRLEDAIVHEADLRVETERSISDKMAAMAAQESRDIQTITAALADLKSDLRALVQASTPLQEPRRR